MHIFVGNLSFKATEEELQREFESFGKVVRRRRVMQRKLGWFPAILLCLFGCTQAPTIKLQPPAQVSTTDGVPVAEVFQNEFDFGEMTEDGTYAHGFRIMNKGTGVLEITKVVPG